MVKDIPKRCAGGGDHRWITKDEKVIGVYTKGAERDKSYALGDYEECEKCPEGRFVPYSPGYSPVSCERIYPASNLGSTEGT